MGEKKMEIGQSLCLCVSTWGDGPDQMEVDFEYTERSSDHWSSDSETSVDVGRDKAVELVKFLCMAFNIKKEEI